ncbi:hypothetical protein [Aerolutibacter ruishenii]|uniref:Uncharacterized protein n=1 Tax=Aerolutibacter ruishenii TaxID=686800 RepID=A0A562LI63_9GAMM|nr:hypothetical protein [Lysobacter ruishenii]TWI07295.1 hypothetical protein IP93_02647 [Lysobacter ruishenii]
MKTVGLHQPFSSFRRSKSHAAKIRNSVAFAAGRTVLSSRCIERLVARNAERAAEEARGLVRWLRPEFQNPQACPADAPAPGRAEASPPCIEP